VAGRQSLEALAHEVAVTHFQRAIDTMGSEPTDVAHALLIGQLGQAQAAMDRHDDAATNIELGFNYFADHGHTNEAVELMTYPYQTPVFFRLSQVVERALGIVPQHSVEAARMVTASVLTGTGLSRHTLPYQQIKTAVEIAREHGDLRLEMDAYAAEATIAGFVADYERSLDAARRALAIGGGIHNPGSRLRAMNWINLCAIGLGRSDETENTLEDFRSAAVELHERGWQVNAVYNALALSLAQGEYPRVVDLAGDGLDLSPGNPRILAPMAIAQYNLGELQTARETASALMAEIRRTNWDTIFASASFCRVYLSAQRNADPDELADEISEAAESASAFTDRDFSRLLWSGMLIPLVKILPGLRPDAATQEFYRSVKSVLNVWSAEPIDTEKAELALIRGDRGSALKYRTAALEFTRNSGYRGSQAWCSFDLAEMLLERDESGDTEKAIELQDEAIAIATELGMKPLLERVLAQREILKA
jgi:tetratricopeptide (TPR) repeat protein